jgi:hypothetical protein
MSIDAFHLPTEILHPDYFYEWKRWVHPKKGSAWTMLARQRQLVWIRCLARDYPGLPRRGHYVYWGGLHLCYSPKALHVH